MAMLELREVAPAEAMTYRERRRWCYTPFGAFLSVIIQNDDSGQRFQHGSWYLNIIESKARFFATLRKVYESVPKNFSV